MRGDHSVDRSALLLTVLVTNKVHILWIVDAALVRAGLRLARPRLKQELGALTVLSLHGKS